MSISSMFLQAAFMLADPDSAKKLLNLTVFFVLLVSAGVKAAGRTLMKLNPTLLLHCAAGEREGRECG